MDSNNKPSKTYVSSENKPKDIATDLNTMITYSGRIGGEMVRRMIQEEELKLMNKYNEEHY